MIASTSIVALLAAVVSAGSTPAATGKQGDVCAYGFPLPNQPQLPQCAKGYACVVPDTQVADSNSVCLKIVGKGKVCADTFTGHAIQSAVCAHGLTCGPYPALYDAYACSHADTTDICSTVKCAAGTTCVSGLPSPCLKIVGEGKVCAGTFTDKPLYSAACADGLVCGPYPGINDAYACSKPAGQVDVCATVRCAAGYKCVPGADSPCLKIVKKGEVCVGNFTGKPQYMAACEDGFVCGAYPGLFDAYACTESTKRR